MKFTVGSGRRMACGAVAALSMAAITSATVTGTASASTSAGAQLYAVEREVGIEMAATVGDVYSSAPSLSVSVAALKTLASQMSADVRFIQGLAVPAGLKSKLEAVAAAGSSYASDVRALASKASSQGLAYVQKTFNTLNGNAASAPAQVFSTDSEKLLKALGQPNEITSDPWFGAQPVGKLVYKDNFSNPKSGWLTANNVKYSKGALLVTASPHHGAQTGRSDNLVYDSSHVTVQVTASVTNAAKLQYGIVCPAATNAPHPAAVIVDDGTWFIGSTNFATNTAVAYNSSSKPNPAIHAGAGTNRIRVDCDQYASGYTDVRLYVNGAFLGEQNMHVAVAANINPGIQIFNPTSTPQTVRFTNWSVSFLAAPPAPPVPLGR